jgi:hypothetical protein
MASVYLFFPAAKVQNEKTAARLAALRRSKIKRRFF